MKSQARIFLLLSAILMSLPLTSSAESSQLAISMRIIESGTELSIQSVLVREATETSMSVSGDTGHTLSLVVSSLEDGRAHVQAEIETAKNKISPTLVVDKGEWASTSVGELEFQVLVRDHVATE